MLKYENIKSMCLTGIYSRPDGYNGGRAEIQFSIIGNDLYEVSECGYYRCPAISTVQDAKELEWLIDNHPNFREYRKEK